MVNIDNNDTPPEKDQDDVAAAADDAEELFNDFGDGDNFSSDGEVYDDDDGALMGSIPPRFSTILFTTDARARAMSGM